MKTQALLSKKQALAYLGTDQKVRRLTRDQLDGCACVVCGDNFRPMLPLGLQTKISSEVFRCERADCEVSPGDVQLCIHASE